MLKLLTRSIPRHGGGGCVRLPRHFPRTEHKFFALRTIQRKVVRGSLFVDMSQLRLTCVLIDFQHNEIYIIAILQDSVTVMQRLQVSRRHNK